MPIAARRPAAARRLCAALLAAGGVWALAAVQPAVAQTFEEFKAWTAQEVGPLKTVARLPRGVVPRDLTAAADGTIFVLSADGVVAIPPGGTAAPWAPAAAADPVDPVALHADGRGTLLLVDAGGPAGPVRLISIGIADGAMGTVFSWMPPDAHPDTRPMDMTVDPDRRIVYVTEIGPAAAGIVAVDRDAGIVHRTPLAGRAFDSAMQREDTMLHAGLDATGERILLSVSTAEKMSRLPTAPLLRLDRSPYPMTPSGAALIGGGMGAVAADGGGDVFVMLDGAIGRTRVQPMFTTALEDDTILVTDRIAVGADGRMIVTATGGPGRARIKAFRPVTPAVQGR